MLVALISLTPAELVTRIEAFAATTTDPDGVRVVLEQLAADAAAVRAELEKLGGQLPAKPSGGTWGELEIAAAMATAQRLAADLADARARIAAAVVELEQLSDPAALAVKYLLVQ